MKATTAKDVLHFYRGTPAMVIYKDNPELNYKVVFMGLECDGTPLVIDPPTLKQHFIEVGKIKLILRPLSSMTEEEAIQVADIVIGSFDSVKWKVDKKFKVVNEIVTNEFIYFDVHKKHRGYSKSLTIDEHGEIDVYEGQTIDQYMNQHLVSAFLLSKGFDIFNLHESGECLHESDIK